MLHNKYFEIMKKFLNGYFRDFYGRGLIGTVKMSQKNISLTLNELEIEGILKSEMRGNRRHYSLNFNNILLTQEIICFENLRKLEFLKKNKKLIDFLNNVNGSIVCVFGSYAKETNNKNSDLDLFIVGKVNSLKLKRFGEDYGIDVQIFNVSFKDFINSIKRNDEIFNEVLKNHVLIKGVEMFVQEVLR
jgi:predicted nucleotidyltransferase